MIKIVEIRVFKEVNLIALNFPQNFVLLYDIILLTFQGQV